LAGEPLKLIGYLVARKDCTARNWWRRVRDTRTEHICDLLDTSKSEIGQDGLSRNSVVTLTRPHAQ
jgi:hypothetical protein